MKIVYRLLLSIVLSVIVITILPTYDALISVIIFIAIALAAFTSPLIPQNGNNVSGNGSSPARSSKASGREQGTVKWFNVSKGYGFVTRENGEEIFVHFRSIRGEGRRILRDGDPIEFTVTEGDKGPQAEDVETL